ncbi:MAG TPA: hypothetical protein VM120_10205 [Bryobacteraceae bacterium]|nr:hypothetical protein [Bryobacteraceae bacterium]
MAQAGLVIAHANGVPCKAEQPFDSRAVMRNFTHELRQPLSTIESAAYYLKMILGGSEPRAHQPIEKIQQMVQQANWILSDAIHLLQTLPPKPEWIDLTEFIADQLLTQAMHQQVEVDWSDSSAVPLVRMDPYQAEHMVRALLSVFRQFAGAHKVYLSLYRDCENVVLACSCQASDQLAEAAEELLQPFAPQLPPGSGLALVSVKRIVETHSGRMAMRGEAGVLKLEVILPDC